MAKMVTHVLVCGVQKQLRSQQSDKLIPPGGQDHGRGLCVEPSLAIESQTQEEDYDNINFKLAPCNVIKGFHLHQVNKLTRKIKHKFLTDTNSSPVDLIMFKSPLKYRDRIN